jgi:hypothetical protein
MSEQNSNSNSKLGIAAVYVASVVAAFIFILTIVIAFVPPKNLTQVKVEEWFKGKKNDWKKPKCSTDGECLKRVCKNRAGCCAQCVDGKCEAGALTAQGCLISSGTGKSDDDNTQNQNNMSGQQQQPHGGQVGHGTISRYDVHGKYNMNMDGPGLSFPPGVGAPQVTNDQEAYLQKCTGENSNPDCCAVAQNGMAFQGVLAPDGSCQTAIQQAGYPGAGLAPPNTYVVSSSGTKFGISMGSCSVKPITSGLAHYYGFHDSCLPGTAPTDYSRSGAYSANYSSCG